LHEIKHDGTGSGEDPLVMCTAVAYPRTVTVTLGQPLGARVLVDATTKSVVPVVG
jgi:hypothetical protein